MNTMKYNEQIKAVTDFFHRSEKSNEEFLIGAELEFFLLDKNTFRAISYYEDEGVKYLLEALIGVGFETICDGENIVGAVGKDLVISLEPGAQFEMSLYPQHSLSDLENVYIKFMKDLEPVLQKREQILYAAGYQPVSRIEEIPFIPKKRYKFMSEYLRKQGCYALNMMKGTASIQVAIDYSSEKDFAAKMLLASQLTPVLAAVFDNSPIFEGEKFEKHCLRTLIWNNCDNSRCGLIPQVFQTDFGYRKYAEYILNQVPIFINKENGTTEYDRAFKHIFRPESNAEKQLDHIFSMCFPDVRARNFIELRMADSLPYPFNFAFIELVQKIFYDREVFAEISNLLKEINMQEVNDTKTNVINSGIHGELGGEEVISIFRKIMSLAGRGNSENFSLNHLIADSGKPPKDLLREGYLEQKN